MSWLKALAGIGGAVAAPFTGGASLALPAIVGGAGAAMGAGAQAGANNRGEKFGGQMDLMKLLMERDQATFDNQFKAANSGLTNQISAAQEGRTSASDAWSKLLAAQRVLSPAQMPQVSKYQAPQRMPTDVERQGAEALTREVMARLQGGNPISAPSLPEAPNRQITNNDAAFRVDPGLLNAGWVERLLGAGGAGMTLAGMLARGGGNQGTGYPDTRGAGSFGG